MTEDFGLRQIRIRGFRSARGLSFLAGPLCALVGEANVGKSNVLAAIWTLLDRSAPVPAADDVWVGAIAQFGSRRRSPVTPSRPAAERGCARSCS